MKTCRQGHPLVEENVYLTKAGARQCKTCKKAYVQKRRAEWKAQGLDSDGKARRKRRGYAAL